jgi:3-oxoacyl-[acyl-carrier-protein] synthase II
LAEQRRVVITGLGIISALGQDVPTYWDGLCNARSGIKKITGWDASEFTTQIAGEIPEFDALQWVGKKESRRIDRFAHMAIAAAQQAVGDSGLEIEQEDLTRCGVIVGTGIGGLLEIEEQHKRMLDKGPRRVSPFLVPKLMANAASGHVSIKYGFRGPNFSTSSACASSSHSLGQAFRTVKYGEADVMLAGGAEAAITPLGMAGFCSAQAMSSRNDDPTAASRPFDVGRDGFVMGEGSGMVVMEEYEHAKKRGATIYAEVFGFGQSADAMHIVEPDPQGRGAGLAMTCALREAGCNPDEVDYVNAHGTSTPLGDVAETMAIKSAFGDHAKNLAITSTKSMIGHLLGGSGGAEIVATVLCIHNGIIHPTANLDDQDPRCDLDYVPNVARKATIRKAISNSFGFGGHNATLLVGQPD